MLVISFAVFVSILIDQQTSLMHISHVMETLSLIILCK
jgi:hypothetical protein